MKALIDYQQFKAELAAVWSAADRPSVMIASEHSDDGLKAVFTLLVRHRDAGPTAAVLSKYDLALVQDAAAKGSGEPYQCSLPARLFANIPRADVPEWMLDDPDLAGRIAA